MFSKGCVLTFWAEATQCLRFGGGYISQSQCALIKILVSEQMGQTHSGGIVSYVGAELLWDTTRTVNNIMLYNISNKSEFIHILTIYKSQNFHMSKQSFTGVLSISVSSSTHHTHFTFCSLTGYVVLNPTQSSMTERKSVYRPTTCRHMLMP